MANIRQFLSAKWIAAFLAVFALVGLLFALFMQHVIGVQPCPLCVTQRVELIAVGICAFMGFLLSRFNLGLRLGLMLASLFALMGIFTSGWQIFIQANRPDSVECGPGIEYMISNFPLTEAVPMIFAANSECAVPSYIIPDLLTIPQASFVAFLFAFAVAGFGIYRTSRERRRDIFR